MKTATKEITSAVAKALIASVALHLAQKYVLKGVDAIEYKIVQRNKKKRHVGFYR